MTEEELVKGYTLGVLDKGYVRYIDHMGTDLDIVEAARVSYSSPSKGEEQDHKLLSYLYRNNHTSPFEMVKLKLDIKMPIFVARQYMRHRMQNINEESARYTEVKDDFYIPTVWRAQDNKNKQGSVETDRLDHHGLTEALKKSCQDQYELYQSMLAAGVAREMARMVLPLNTYTSFYCCWDMNNLLKFLRLRNDAHAQMEHQEYAKAIQRLCAKLFPATIKEFTRGT